MNDIAIKEIDNDAMGHDSQQNQGTEKKYYHPDGTGVITWEMIARVEEKIRRDWLARPTPRKVKINVAIDSEDIAKLDTIARGRIINDGITCRATDLIREAVKAYLSN